MRCLIIYMSHHGTTRKVVARMTKELGPATTAVDLERDPAPGLIGFDVVLIGGSIHIGQLQRKLKAYCETHQDELLKKKMGLFLCFMNTQHANLEFNNAFPEVLRNHAFAKGMFGGELLENKMNFMEKFLIRQVNGSKGVMSTLDQEAIDGFVRAVKKVFRG